MNERSHWKWRYGQKLLNVIRRMEFCQNFRTAHYLMNLIHISADTSNIHRDNDFGVLRDNISQFIVIHLDIVLLRIHQDNGSTDMSETTDADAV